MEGVRSERFVEKLPPLQGHVTPRTRLQVWFIRVCSSILIWTCLVQLVTVGELWHPHLLGGIPGFTKMLIRVEGSLPSSPPPLVPARNYTSNGFLKVSCNGGLNQMRSAICDMVIVARLLNLTLVVPELDKTSFWADPSNFEDIFDVRHFIDSLRDEVLIIKRLPKNFGLRYGYQPLVMPPVSWSSEQYYLQQPLADAEGAKRFGVIELLKSYGGVSDGPNGSHFEPRPVPPPLPNKCDWEIDPDELDFSNSVLVGKGSFGEIRKAFWRGTPVAVKRILPKLSEDRLVIQDFRHEVNLLVKLRHPNIVQFLGAVTEKKPLMLITEFLRGGDLHQHLMEKRALSPSTAINFALDIARGMAHLHSEPNVIIHRDLKPRNILLVNTSADHLKVGDFGLSKLIRVQHSHEVYKMTGETGSYRYMAPEVFNHWKYDKKVDVFSFAMILYQMLEGDPPMSNYEPYEAARCVAEGHRPNFRAKGFIPELRELTEQCWAADMDKRPSFLEILKWLEKIKEKSTF